jgi:hypothetical protein
MRKVVVDYNPSGLPEQAIGKVAIIPGNRYFRLEGKRGIFHQLLPLEAEGREGRFHREICPFDQWWVTETMVKL